MMGGPAVFDRAFLVYGRGVALSADGNPRPRRRFFQARLGALLNAFREDAHDAMRL